ncbi:MAG TPA: NAD-dependent epimerase/dehydratase family protein [Anaeromyxobacteraceae bacterium]|nr:NAD-dependent epimerase/dehydratase family protein [Anaeromyxobacteraceae bacterium]
MHVLLVGGTRFVGPLLAWRLLAGGHRVTVLTRGRQPDALGDRVERLRADRTTPAFREVLRGRDFDACVDLAAFTGDDGRGAVEALGGRVGHHVMISTGQVYLVRERGAAALRPAREEDYDGPVMARPPDGSPDLAEWEYGMGKRACEDALAEAFDRLRFPATRVRIPMVNGERDYFRRIEGYLWRLVDGGPILLPGGGSAPTRHVYAGEVARFVAGLLGRPETFGRAFNLAQEEAPSLAELVQRLAAHLGARADLAPVAEDALGAAGLAPRDVSPFSTRWMSFVDPSRAREELGFRHLPLDAYLGRIVASFLAHTPTAPPDGYAGRARERALAAALRA